MATDLMQPGGGLTNSKLALATATEKDAIQGKTFYSKNKTLKTGTMIDHSSLTAPVNLGSNGSTELYVRIPFGAYRNAAPAGYPAIVIPMGTAIANIPGGDRGAWSATLYPGQVVSVPKGYHNGQGKVTSYVWTHDKYLYFACQFQGGYGLGPIANHVATLINDGSSAHEPGFAAHEMSMYNGSANVCGAGMISVDPNDNTGIAKMTALARIRNIFNKIVYNPGEKFTMSGGTVACFRFE